MDALVQFGDCYQEFITEMLQFQVKQAQAQIKLTKFKINCNNEWEVEKWLRKPVEPFVLLPEDSQLRQRLKIQPPEEEQVSFLSREQEFERVCAEFRTLLKQCILPLVERKLELQSLLQRLETK